MRASCSVLVVRLVVLCVRTSVDTLSLPNDRVHVLPLYRCAFLFFCSEKRPQLKAQSPGASVGELAKQLAGAWKSMSGDQKRPYEIMAERDKERYDQQKSAYIAGFQASKMQQELAGTASSSQSSSNFNPTTSAAMTLPIVPGMPSLPQISQQVTIPAGGGSTVGLSAPRGKKKKDPNMPKRSM